MTALLRYDAARQALAEARSYDEVRDWEDKAAAVREYARRSRNREMEIDALEIRVRAQRRRGELLAEMRRTGVLAEGRKKLSVADDSLARVTLDELDTTRDESSLAQKLAAIEPDAFERLAARCRARLETDERAHTFDVLKENAAPSGHMASRITPPDDLDYSPTPPWATRALFDIVLPRLDVWPADMNSVHDPACGEGHMTGVFEEYAGLDVYGSDIFDYSNDGRSPPGWDGVCDFLLPETARPGADWIITNPPFNEKALEFALCALDRAQKGVAIFAQLRWLETVDRYNQLFQPTPPTQIALFVERVPLHMGRWDPDGSTATSYVWIVWQKGVAPKPLFWIPPICRATLLKPTDRERFTAHPVLPIGQTTDGTKFDPGTGEINSEEACGGEDVTAPDQITREQAEAGEPSASGADPASDPFASLNFDKPGFESQAKAEEAVRPDTAQAKGMLPRGDESRTADIADDAASRLAGGRTPDATDEHGRDSLERQPGEGTNGETPPLVGSDSSKRSWSDVLIPDFLKRDRNNRASFMRGEG